MKYECVFVVCFECVDAFVVREGLKFFVRVYDCVLFVCEWIFVCVYVFVDVFVDVKFYVFEFVVCCVCGFVVDVLYLVCGVVYEFFFGVVFCCVCVCCFECFVYYFCV